MIIGHYTDSRAKERNREKELSALTGKVGTSPGFVPRPETVASRSTQ
jgi:hypothetical protein